MSLNKTIFIQVNQSRIILFSKMKFASVSLLAALISSASAFAPSNVAAPRTANVGFTALEMARRPFISGNWKLNPQTKQEAIELATAIASAVTHKSPDADVALFVPYVFLESAMEAVGGKVQIGAEVCRNIAYQPIFVLRLCFYFVCSLVSVAMLPC